MNSYEFVSKEWIVSPIARRIYLAAATVSLTLYFSLAAILLNVRAPLLKQLVLIGVVGTAVTGIAMECFLFRFDDSAAWKQISWFCMMLFFPLGPALYCFLVYSRSSAFTNRSTVQESVIDNAKPFR